MSPNPVILAIKETHRLRQDMLRAETSLTLRIGAQRCRIMCGGIQRGQRHACGRVGRYGIRPGMADSQGHALVDIHDHSALTQQERGHCSHDDQCSAASLPDECDHRSSDTHEAAVALTDGGEGHGSGDNHDFGALTADTASIPLRDAREVVARARKMYERQIERYARDLLVWPWVESIRGFGALGLGQIVGECGDLDNYANPAKVWKRMGLAVIDGQRQRRVTGDAAFEHGYDAERRSIMWVIGDSLLKGNRGGEYRAYYDAEKVRRRELFPDLPPIATHLQAKRHMEKRLLRNLWRAWRGEEG